MTKHRYTKAEAPTNTGSVSRPARLNLRLDCSDRARTHKVLSDIRELLGLPKGYCYADVWAEAALPALEHLCWHLRESPTAMKGVARSMFRPLPAEDYVRNRYAALKARLEPQPRRIEQEVMAL
jgi:hypothetical protein